MPTLRDTFAHLRRVAQTSGTYEGCLLPGGARLDVQVLGATTRVCLSRRHRALSRAEIAQAVAQLQIPASARRLPENRRWQETRPDYVPGKVEPDTVWYVIYDWETA